MVGQEGDTSSRSERQEAHAAGEAYNTYKSINMSSGTKRACKCRVPHSGEGFHFLY